MPKRHVDHMKAQRERILRAAIGCMGDLGLERTSIATIRKQANLSTGAIYKHFSSKEEIITEALRFAAMKESMVPATWPELANDLARLDDEMGFDLAATARTNLQLLASGLKPGPIQDMLKPMMEGTLSFLAERLSTMEKAGQIRLIMTPLQTAMCITALADGLTWVGLACNRSRADISRDIAAGLEHLVGKPFSQIEN